jgi:hypothetical protein
MSGCGCEDEDGLLSNDFSSCSSKGKSKVNSSTIQYDGDKLICTVEGVTRFNIRSCSTLNSVLKTFAEQICLLNNNTSSNYYISNVALEGTNLVFTNDGDAGSLAFNSFVDLSSFLDNTDNYISNVEIIGSDLIFTNNAVGSLAFQGTIDLSALVIAGGAVVSADNGLGIDPSNNVQLGGTLLKNTNIGLSTFDFTLNTNVFSVTGSANGNRVGIGTANPFIDQVAYASDPLYSSPFVIRTDSDRFGWNHNNGLVEVVSYVSTAAYIGTITNHRLYLMTDDQAGCVLTDNRNFLIGDDTEESTRVKIRGVDATSSNFALKVQNSVSEELLSVRNDKRIALGGSWAGNDLLVVDGSNGQIRTNLTGQGFYDSEFLIRSNDTNPVMFHVSKSSGSFTFLVQKEGSDIFRSWNSLVSGDGWSIANEPTNGLAYLNLGGVPRFALIGSDIVIDNVNSPDILHWTDGGSGDVRQVLISSVRGLGYPAPFLDISTGDRATFTCENRINTVGHSYLAVNTGTASDYLGIGTKTPLEKVHSTAKIRADVAFNVNGTDGFTGTGAYTNFTIVGGIITAAT